MSLKKNCTNCVHLEWGFGDINDPEGLMCNQRNYYQGGGDSSQKERFHQKQLENKAYLEKPKKCCTLKSTPEKV